MRIDHTNLKVPNKYYDQLQQEIETLLTSTKLIEDLKVYFSIEETEPNNEDTQYSFFMWIMSSINECVVELQLNSEMELYNIVSFSENQSERYKSMTNDFFYPFKKIKEKIWS